MIEINLLPEELKAKTKSRLVDQPGSKSPLALLQDQVFIYAIGAVLVLLILAHFYCVFLLVAKNNRLVSLNRKWSGMAVQKKALDEFNRGSSVGIQDIALLSQLNRQKILWAQKLNELSLQLPSGVWFDEIAINVSSLTIKGSVISLAKEEVQLINKLLDNLKGAAEFSKDFSSFELSKVQKRALGGYDISDFILVGALKSK